MKPTTKEDFHNILKYGKDYAEIKHKIDHLCHEVDKLNGNYSIIHDSKIDHFIVHIHIPAWNNPHSVCRLATNLAYNSLNKINLDRNKIIEWNIQKYDTSGIIYYIYSEYLRIINPTYPSFKITP